MPPLLSGAPLSFTSDCTRECSPERVWEEPVILALEDGPDFFGLRLLTPLRPIYFSFFEVIKLQVGSLIESICVQLTLC